MSESKEGNRINNSQIYDLITGRDVSWQEIIYDLVRTEQLDPWDIDLSVLADKYIEVIKKLEEENFFISSKVMHACSILLRLKAVYLANKYIPSLDEMLYGKKEQTEYKLERIEIDENEIPILVPRTPMPRYKKVTLQELMSALNKAVETENRRIRKEINVRRAEKAMLTILPKINRINLKDRIKEIFIRIKSAVSPEKTKMGFSELAPSKDEKLAAFLPVLHLSNQEKLYLRQETHFDEIFMQLEKIEMRIEGLEEEIKDIKDSEYEVEEENDFVEDSFASQVKPKVEDSADDEIDKLLG
jgi:segregation and condensation protein A